MLLGSLSSENGYTASAQLTGMLCVVQQACQRGELHASLKAFRQSVNKKVYKAQQEPRERRKAVKTCKAGEVSPAPSWAMNFLCCLCTNSLIQNSISASPRQHCSALLTVTSPVLCCLCRFQLWSWQSATINSCKALPTQSSSSRSGPVELSRANPAPSAVVGQYGPFLCR